MLVVLTSHPIQYQAPLWRELAALGLKFEVWFLTDQGVRKTDDKDFGQSFAWDVDLLSGYPHRFLNLSGPWNLHAFNGIPLVKPMATCLREAGATALWTEGWRFKAQWDAVAAARRMGIPVFLRGETSDKIPPKGGWRGLVRKIALRRLFGQVDYFLAIGQASRRFYLQTGVAPDKLFEAPYCVDNQFFRAAVEKLRRGGTGDVRSELAESRREVRQAWQIPENSKVVMFCGKFVAKKRPLDLVLAARAHFDRNNFENCEGESGPRHPWHLLFVGSGELGGELRARCDVLFDAEAPNGKITKPRNFTAPPASFVGFLNQSQIPRAYAVADVVVLPSEWWETWGLVINEATAAGVPTVVSDQCGCSDDFVLRCPFTKVFPAGDIGVMARSIEEALSRKASPEEISACAEAFSPSITARTVAHCLGAA